MRGRWWLGMLAVASAVVPSQWVRLRSAGRIRTLRTIPPNDVALVLGAGVRLDGRPSRILRGRLRVARELYEAGKVSRLLVSGSPRSRGHSEPQVMRQYLVARGVDREDIIVDETGVNTWRSCLVAAKVLRLNSVTVVTTNFHLRRAIWLCRSVGVDAYGTGHDAGADGLPVVNARGVCREQLAVIKAFWRPFWRTARNAYRLARPWLVRG